MVELPPLGQYLFTQCCLATYAKGHEPYHFSWCEKMKVRLPEDG